MNISIIIQKMVDIPPPDCPSADTDQFDISEWKVEFSDYVHHRKKIKSQLRMVYSIIWGKSTERMRAKLATTKDFVTISTNQDSIAMLKEIRCLSYNFDAKRKPAMSIVSSIIKLYWFLQGKEMTTAAYYRKFSDMVSIIEHYGGSVGNHPFLVEQDIVLQTGQAFDTTASYDATLMKNARMSSSDDYLACLFLTNACRHRYGISVHT